jgi:HK97 family phage major capsid protein
VENAILNGLGPTPVAPNKPQPTGILTGVTWGAGNSATYTTSVGYDDLVGARALLKTPYRPFGKWILNSNMEAALFKIKDSQNRPIFTQAPQNGFEPRILNHPYIVDDYMPDDEILFAALNYYYMNFSQNPIIEASKEAGFTSASTIYRGILIADGKPALSETFVKLSKAA